MFPVKYFILLTALYLFSAGCTPQARYISQEQIRDGQYDSEFPATPVHPYLEQITRSVKLVSVLSFYKSFHFGTHPRVIKSDLSAKDLRHSKIGSSIFEIPSSGTATIIYLENTRMAFITCAHIVDAPDTVIRYYDDDLGRPTPYIKSVSLKIKQNINILDVPAGREIEVLATDKGNDIALLGKRLNEAPDYPYPVFDYPWGQAEELQWGTVVYLIGFPAGKKMLSRALVSDPNRDARHSFLLDAYLHRGVSGGIILALRDGPPNFELVGLANALSGQKNYVLRPDINMVNNHNQKPYSGDIFVDEQVTLIAGVTYAVPVESLRAFLREHKDEIYAKGYYLKMP